MELLSARSLRFDGNGRGSTNNYSYVVAGGSASSYRYDADGNCLSDGLRSYKWDAMNRLIQITEGANTYAFAYDGGGHRVSETDNGTRVNRWVWDGNTMVQEQSGLGVVQKDFYSQGENHFTGQDEWSGKGRFYYTRDHLGSVREILDDLFTFTLVRYSYDAYGRMTETHPVAAGNISSVEASFQYTGDYYHAATGLNLTKFRAYDSNTGRWLSRDPIAERGGINLYGYVGEDPTGRVDAFGLAWAEVPGSIKLTSLWTSSGIDWHWQNETSGFGILDGITAHYAASATVNCACNGQIKQASGIRIADRNIDTGPMGMRTSVGSLPLTAPSPSGILESIGELFGMLTEKHLPTTSMPDTQQTQQITNDVKGALPKQSDIGSGWFGGKSPCRN